MDNIEELYKIVNKRLSLRKSDIKCKSRKIEIVNARRIIALMLMQHMKSMSFEKIGKAIGKDHATISHYKRTTPGLLETDSNLKENYDYIDIQFRVIVYGFTLEVKLKKLLEDRGIIEKEIVSIEEAIETKKKLKNKELCA